MDHWLELKHRKEAHTAEAGVRGLGWLQEEVRLLEVHNKNGFLTLFFNTLPNEFGSTMYIFNCVFWLHSEPAAKVMVELLGSYTEDNASQARVDAHR